MPRFTVRVELHNRPSGDDYDILHAAMEALGFKRTITEDSTGLDYKLPTAEYNIVIDRTKYQVLRSAKQAASQVGKAYSVLVTKSAGRTWYNLDLD